MKKRLFVAIPLADKIRDQLAAYPLSHEDLKVTKKENLHITACFLGEVEETDIPEVVGKIIDVATKHDVFSLEFEGFRFIRTTGRGMVWAQFKANDKYKNFVQAMMSVLNVKKDHKDYIPHVTLARTKNGDLENSLNLEQIEVPSVNVSTCELVLSELSEDGSEYTVIEKFFLRSDQ